MSDAASRLSARDLAELAALADGTLPPERRAAVEARVAGSPELLELYQRQVQAVSAARTLAGDQPSPALREAVVAQRHALDAQPGRAWWRVPVPRLALAGVLAAVAVIVGAVVLTGRPGGPSVAEAAALAERPPTAPAPQREPGSESALAIGVDGVAFPDLARSYGWRADGIRRDRLDGRDATTVFYGKDGERIAYVIVSGSGLRRPSGIEEATRDGVLFQTMRSDGRYAVTWRRAGHTCVLVGTTSPDELLRLASWRGDGTLRY
jgi:anti-sigma factor RsiW